MCITRLFKTGFFGKIATGAGKVFSVIKKIVNNKWVRLSFVVVCITTMSIQTCCIKQYKADVETLKKENESLKKSMSLMHELYLGSQEIEKEIRDVKSYDELIDLWNGTNSVRK